MALSPLGRPALLAALIVSDACAGSRNDEINTRDLDRADAGAEEDAQSEPSEQPELDGGTAQEAGEASEDAGAQATLFLSHAVNNAIYRFAIEPGSEPRLTATLQAMGPEGLALSPQGELFAAATDGSILRFADPLGTPSALPALRNLGITDPEELAFVDGELWVPSVDYRSCTNTASRITRIAFDASGAASAAGVLQAPGIITAARGLLWDPGSRTLFLSNCHTVNSVQPYRVAQDRALSALPVSTGGTLRNPHGMVLAPWGELFVNSADGNQVARFTIDAQGALTANGVISGNGLSFPIDLGFAPWGELFVVNQGMGSVSRFVFDDAYAASPSGSYATGLDSSPQTHRLGWMLLVSSRE